MPFKGDRKNDYFNFTIVRKDGKKKGNEEELIRGVDRRILKDVQNFVTDGVMKYLAETAEIDSYALLSRSPNANIKLLRAVNVDEEKYVFDFLDELRVKEYHSASHPNSVGVHCKVIFDRKQNAVTKVEFNSKFQFELDNPNPAKMERIAEIASRFSEVAGPFDKSSRLVLQNPTVAITVDNSYFSDRESLFGIVENLRERGYIPNVFFNPDYDISFNLNVREIIMRDGTLTEKKKTVLSSYPIWETNRNYKKVYHYHVHLDFAFALFNHFPRFGIVRPFFSPTIDLGKVNGITFDGCDPDTKFVLFVKKGADGRYFIENPSDVEKGINEVSIKAYPGTLEMLYVNLANLEEAGLKFPKRISPAMRFGREEENIVSEELEEIVQREPGL